MTHLLTGTAALAALIAVWKSDRHALRALLAFASACFLTTLFVPSLWTPESFVAVEGSLCLLATFVGLAAARRARAHWLVTGAALCLMCSAAVMGLIADGHVPYVRNYAYRGVAIADLATAALLLTVPGRMHIHDHLDSVALRYLGLAFGLSGIRLLLFEAHFTLGNFVGWLQVFVWVTGMLLICFASLRARRGAPPLETSP